MGFKYRLQKILDLRIRKKEEQLQVVIKAQEEVQKIEFLIIENLEQIKNLSLQMRQADPMMLNQYDKFIKHLWEQDEKLKTQKQEALEVLKKETDLLRIKEQEVNVLEKHKENQKEEYIKEQKALELKELNEIGSQKYFIRNREKLIEEEQEELNAAQNSKK